MRWWAVMSLMHQKCRMMLVGWLIFRLKLLKILKCFSCPWSNLFVQQTLKRFSRDVVCCVEPSCSRLGDWQLTNGSCYRLCIFTNPVSSSGNWQTDCDKMQSPKLCSVQYPLLSQDDLTPPTTRCLIQNFWNSQANFYRFAWPNWTLPCGKGAL